MLFTSATFLRYSLGNREELNVILAGPSNADLAESGQGAVLSLTKATAALLTYASESVGIERLNHDIGLSAMVTALSSLADTTSKEFIKVHRALEREMRAEKGTPSRISGRAPRPGR
jgi:hypothetical protein